MGRVTNLLALRADHRHGEPPKNQRLNYLQGIRIPSTATVDVRARVWVDVWVRVYLRRAGGIPPQGRAVYLLVGILLYRSEELLLDFREQLLGLLGSEGDPSVGVGYVGTSWRILR